jgi:hypothetical protein
MLAGTPDNLRDVASRAQCAGITSETVNEIYSKYGKTIQARSICALLGTTPEALKADADAIVGSNRLSPAPVRQSVPKMGTALKSKFPRLK